MENDFNMPVMMEIPKMEMAAIRIVILRLDGLVLEDHQFLHQFALN